METGIRKSTLPVIKTLGGNKYLGLLVHAGYFTGPASRVKPK